MTSEQFEQAVDTGYDRIKRFASSYVRNCEVHNPTDVLHNALLWFRVKLLATFEWRTQEEWESIILKRIIWDIANYRKGQVSALDFKDVVVKDYPDSMDDRLNAEKEFFLSEAFADAISSLDSWERQVVLAVLAGFKQRQIADMIGIDRRRVSEVWTRALRIARAHMKADAFDEST